MRTLMFSILVSAAMIADAFAQPNIYIVRHAEKLEGWFEEGNLDEYHPLSAAGIASAERVTAQLHAEKIARIFSSRTTRTLHTALIISQKVNAPVEVAGAVRIRPRSIHFMLSFRTLSS